MVEKGHCATILNQALLTRRETRGVLVNCFVLSC